MKILILAFFLCMVIPVFAQDSYYVTSNMSELISNYNFKSGPGRNAEELYAGSPYENNEFKEGTLVTKTKHIYKGVPLRLNIFNNDIEFKSNNGEIYAIAQPELFEYFTIGESTYKYFPYQVGKKAKNSYFKVIEKGKATLLAKGDIIYNKPQKAQPYKEDQPGTFIRQPDKYYIQIGDFPAQNAWNKKSIEKIFGSSAEELLQYAETNKLKLSSLEGLQKIIALYNSK